MKISVVVPTFNRRSTLVEVLPSLANQDYPEDDFEILLCDAGSTDGTFELVQELAISNLRFLVGTDSGRGGARNRGIKAARGEIILFTDADIIAEPDLLSQHVRYHEMFPGNAVVGCEIQVASLAEYERCRVEPQRYARHRATRRVLPWHYFLTGNASVAKDILIEVGMFDESFTGYGHEDLELGYRLRKRGVTIYYNPAAVNYHWHPVSFEERCRKMRLAGRSTVRFFRKHRDWRIALIMGWNPLSILLHSLLPLDGVVMRFLISRVDRSHLAREIVLQHHYVSGIKEAWLS